MKIISISINNFRNLDNVKFSLNENINFIVGENNLGKSNFLIMLDILFSKKTFSIDDFYDLSLPITVYHRKTQLLAGYLS